MNNKKAYLAMTTARSTLIIDHPFFGCLVMQLKLVECPWIETMAVDGVHLFYNPEFALATPELERIGVIAHEGYHCAYKHHLRMGDRDLEDWNKAADYVINNDMLRAGFKLPSWVLKDPAYLGMSTEEVYNRIHQPKPRKPEQKSGNQGQGQGAPGKGTAQGHQTPGKGNAGQGQGNAGQAPGNSGQPQFVAPDPGKMGGVIMPQHVQSWNVDALANEEARWDIITRMAVSVAKSANAGVVPGYLERLVDNLERSRIDWSESMRNFVDSTTTSRYTWNAPNRRLLHRGMILPSLSKPENVRLAVSVMDTSGSMTPKFLNKVAAEHRALLDEGVVNKLVVIYADTKVHRVQEFERGDEVVLNPKGGGGTDFRKSFKYIEEHYSDASVVLYFTDMQVKNFGEDPQIPVLWIVYSNSHAFKDLAKKAPFSEAIHAVD